MQKNKRSYTVAIALIFVGAFSRLIEHIPNFSAFEALALFGGAYLTSKVAAYSVPIIAMYLSDLALNNTIMRPFFPNHEGFVLFDDYMIFNIIAMLVVVLIGRTLLKKPTAIKILGGTISASIAFFLITNIGSWLKLPIYTKDFSGLMASYVAAKPFFQTSLISSIIFTTILFGSFELYKRFSSNSSTGLTKFATEKLK